MTGDQCVVVIVQSWNGTELLPDCLESLRRQAFSDYAVAVVDDGSTDRSAQVVVERFPEARLICRERQGGFCAAVNTGIRATQSEFVALLNNDAVADPGWLAWSVAALRRESSFAGCAPKILFRDRPDTVNSIGIFLRADGASRDIGYGRPDGPWCAQPMEVFGVSGCAAVIRRAAFDDVGLFDERLWAYSEDLDWCLRARALGHRFLFEPRAVVLHRGGATFGQMPEAMTYWQSRNALLVLLKNLPLRVLLARAPWLTAFQAYQLAVAWQRGRLRPAAAGKLRALVDHRRYRRSSCREGAPT